MGSGIMLCRLVGELLCGGRNGLLQENFQTVG